MTKLEEAIRAYHAAGDWAEKCHDAWEDAKKREREASSVLGDAEVLRDRAWRAVTCLIEERPAK